MSAAEEISEYELQRMLDNTKSKVFSSEHNAAFLGSLMCSLNFFWSQSIDTAGTDGKDLLWNKDYFLKLPADSRKTDLCHELWHVGLLHALRRGTRDHKLWNIACDIKIDWMLKNMPVKSFAEKFKWDGIDSVLDHAPYNDPKYQLMVEEDIYDDLLQNHPNAPQTCTCAGHELPQPDNHVHQTTINVVMQAIHQAKLSGGAGSLPGVIEQTIKAFLEPVIPWQVLLKRYLTELLDEDYTWKRPNRRYQDMYLPSRFTDDGRLAHLAYYLDVSGSVTDQQVLRFNSEVKYIQEELKPTKLSLIQFSDKITNVREFEIEEAFDKIKVFGRGGTLYGPVKKHMEETKPTAAIIFTDMGFFDAVTKPDLDIPIIWVVMDNKRANIPFGQHIHIKE